MVCVSAVQLGLGKPLGESARDRKLSPDEHVQSHQITTISNHS